MMPLTSDNTQAAIHTLSVVKVLKDRLSALEKSAKTYLSQALGEGEKIVSDEATISRSVHGASTFAVTDAEAYMRWCDANGIEHGGRTQWVFDSWVTNPERLNSILDSTGQMPDGVSEIPGKASILSVRQSSDQRAMLFDNVARLRDVMHVLDSNDMHILDSNDTHVE